METIHYISSDLLSIEKINEIISCGLKIELSEEAINIEKEALRNMSVFRTECRVINPDGSIRWAYYVSQPRIINGS